MKRLQDPMTLFVISLAFVVAFSLLPLPIHAQLDQYNVTNARIEGKNAIEIKFPTLNKEYNLTEEANKLNIDPKQAIGIQKTDYFGSYKVKLKAFKTFNETRGFLNDCKCQPIIALNGSDSLNCNKPCIDYRDVEVTRLVEVDETLKLNNETILYEVPYGCEKIKPNGNIYGCNTFTDVYVLGQKIEGATWWNETFNYKVNIIVLENSNNNLVDYQIKLSVNTSALISQGKMSNDCSDMRFTNSTDDVISHYLEYGECNKTNSIVWVEVPNIPASSNEIISMYYGSNVTVQSTSDGYNTFIAFDDFEYDDGIDNHGWTLTLPRDYFNTTTEIYAEGTRSLKIDKTIGGNNGYVDNIFPIAFSDSDPVILDFRIIGRTHQENCLFSTDIFSSLNALLFQAGFRDTGWFAYTTTIWTNIYDTSNATWYEIRYQMNITGDQFRIDIDNDNKLGWTSFLVATGDIGKLRLSTGSGSSGVGYWDYLHVFKNITVNEPTYTFSDEQTIFVPPVINVTVLDIDLTYEVTEMELTNIYCSDQNTLRKEYYENITSGNETATVGKDLDKICPYGCDFTNNRCRFDPITNMVYFLIFIGYIILILAVPLIAMTKKIRIKILKLILDLVNILVTGIVYLATTTLLLLPVVTFLGINFLFVVAGLLFILGLFFIILLFLFIRNGMDNRYW